MVINHTAHFLEDRFVLGCGRTRPSVPYAEKPGFSRSLIVSIVDVAQNLREELGPLREMVVHLWPLTVEPRSTGQPRAAVPTLCVYSRRLGRQQLPQHEL